MRFEYFLARELCRTHEELIETIPAMEIAHWRGFYELQQEDEKKAIEDAKRK